MYMAVTLRNVNLLMFRNRPSLKYALHEDIDEERSFLAMENGEDSVAGPLQRTNLVESSAQTSAERSRWLATLTKKKQRDQSTAEAKRARREQGRVQK